MAYEDAQLMMAVDQDLEGVAVGTVLSEKSLYMGNAGVVPGFSTNTPINDPGRGTAKRLAITVSEEFDSAGDDTTMFVELVMADNEELTTNLKVLARTPIIAQEQLKVGYQFRLSYLPVGISKKWLGLRFNVGTSVPTAGKIRAGLVESMQENEFVGAQG